MFITLTVDTNIKKNSGIKLRKNKMNPAHGWRKAINVRKRSLWQRVRSWRRSLRGGKYKLDGQAVMF
ncbi:MAG: hypothetical protein ABID64_02095 [Nitrospirota bacterium]